VSSEEEKDGGKQETKYKALFKEGIGLSNEVHILHRAVQDTSGSAVHVAEIYRDVLKPPQLRRLEEIAKAPTTIAEVPEETAWKLLVQYNREIRDILLQRSEAETARGRKEDWRYWLALAVTIGIGLVGWAVALRITQWL